MPYLKAGYFIDEVYDHLVKTVGEPVLHEFYERNLPFKADGFSKKIRISNENPLIKVAWNLVTRGRPTRASLSLSKHILDTHLKKGAVVEPENELESGSISINHKEGKTKIDLRWPELNTLEEDPLKELLDRFHKLSKEQVEQEFGEPYLSLYHILKDLQASAQIQQLLLLMYLSYFPSEEFYVNIKGINDALAAAIVEDLNELFKHLNSLISNNEKPLASIVNEDVIQAHTVLYETKPQLGFRITSITGRVDPKIERKITYLTKIFTDRRIEYAALGDLSDKSKAKEPEKDVEEELPDEVILENENDKGDEQQEELKIDPVDKEEEEAEVEAEAEDAEEGDGQEMANEAIEEVQEISSKPASRFQVLVYREVQQETALLYFLRNVFRLSEFRPLQEVIINRLLQDQDVIGMAPAGTGKSLPFQLCGLLQPGVTLMLEPGPAFIKNQLDSLHTNGIHNVQCLYTFNDIVARRKSLNSLLKSENQFVILSPDWLFKKDFRKNLEAFSKFEVYFSYVVLDEAHAVSEWGHAFNYSYVGAADQIKRWCKPKDKELVLYGITAPTTLDVLRDIQREMDCSEETFISYPANALHPEGMNIRILKVDPDLSKTAGETRFEQVQAMGSAKHRELVQYLQNVPGELTLIESQDKEKEEAFFERDEYGAYANAGLIFCPSPSMEWKNGALSVKNTLESNLSQLDIGVVSGEDHFIESTAMMKETNRNNKNLLIAAHDSGIALDRSNIRYTCHYTFPHTIEGFYQEAGRAGRDGRPAISAILYHPEDLRFNYEQYEQAVNLYSKEERIINELLTEIKYEAGFNLKVLEKKAKLKYPEIGEMHIVDQKMLNVLGSDPKDTERSVQIASVSLQDELTLDADFIQNFDKTKSAKIGRFVINLLKKESKGKDPVAWLNTRSEKGIIPWLKEDPKGVHHLRTGLDNGLIHKIAVALKQRNEDINSDLIRNAYRRSAGPDDFIETIKGLYLLQSSSDDGLNLNDQEASKIQSSYNQIQDTDDTLRALYRLKLAGIIDDYVLDEVAGYVEMEFRAKKEAHYYQTFKDYLTRYFGNGTAGKWLNKARSKEKSTPPEKVVFTFLEFIREEIYERKEQSIDHMKQLCEIGHEQGQEVFKERAQFYFTAKYSGEHYLPKDTKGGKEESAGIVNKYLNFINNPPDGQGGELTNTMHLRNACENFRSEVTEDNASINILMAYCYFTSEIQEGEDVESILNRPMVQQAIELYTRGFKTLEEKEPWIEMVQLLGLFSTKVLDLNPGLKPYLVPLVEKILIHRTSSRLKRFLNKIVSHE